MNIFIELGVLFFTMNVLSLVGISTASMVNDVFAEIDNNNEEMKNSNIDIGIDSISLKNSNEKCTWWDARGC
jgi:hypothetical protein